MKEKNGDEGGCALLERVSDKHQNFLLFVEQQHQTEIAHSFVGKLVGDDQLETFHLSKLSGIAKHVNKEELGDVPSSVLRIIILKGSSNIGAFLGNDSSLLCCRLGLTDDLDEFSQADRHWGRLWWWKG